MASFTTSQASDVAAGPRGIGTSVAIDWALTGQMLGMIVLMLAGVGAAAPLGGNHPSVAEKIVSTIGLAIAGAVTFWIGEQVRSGRLWSMWFMRVLAIAIVLGGLAKIPSTVQAAQHHDFWPIYPDAVMVVLFAVMGYLMFQPQTEAWFKRVTPAEARARHGSPAWLASIGTLAAVGGVLVAVAYALG